MLALLGLLSLMTSVTAEYGCSSFAQLTHSLSGCPVNEGNPDCSFIQANAQQFCSTVATSWEIINGPSCNLRGASYGCIFASGLYSTTDQFCCPLIVVGGTMTPTASSSASLTSTQSPEPTPSPSASASQSPEPTPSPSSSPSLSPEPTPSSNPSLSPEPTPSSNPSLSAVATLTATSTATSTGTFTAVPSTNVTIIYVTTTTDISKGVGAAIGLSAIFGFCILGVCCAAFLRRRPVNEIQKQVSVIERRKSVVEGEKERRKSSLEIRSVN